MSLVIPERNHLSLSESDLNSLWKKGKKIYQTNPHYKKLATIMEHPEFREFYDKYMCDWDSIKVMLMFMKIYETIEKHSVITLSPYQKISIMKEIIDDEKSREEICKTISKWTEL